MFLARQVKCPLCGKMNNKEDTTYIETEKRYYCPDCAEKRKKEKEKHKNGWNELYEYICEIFNIDAPTGFMFKQLKTYWDFYNFTNDGMRLTLKYYHETLEKEIDVKWGLFMIPKYYEEAKEDYKENLILERHLENFEINEKPKVVTIKNIQSEIKPHRKHLSVDDVVWDEGHMND